MKCNWCGKRIDWPEFQSVCNRDGKVYHANCYLDAQRVAKEFKRVKL